MVLEVEPRAERPARSGEHDHPACRSPRRWPSRASCSSDTSSIDIALSRSGRCIRTTATCGRGCSTSTKGGSSAMARDRSRPRRVGPLRGSARPGGQPMADEQHGRRDRGLPPRGPHLPAAGGRSRSRRSSRRRSSTTRPTRTGRASGPARPPSCSTGTRTGTRSSSGTCPFAKWFVGGKLNVCHNAVDRHVAAGPRRQGRLPLGGRARRHPHHHLRRPATPRCSASPTCSRASASPRATASASTCR